jgi:regulator of sigma E protease
VTLDIPFLFAAADVAQGVWPFLKSAGKFVGICIEVLLLFNLLIFVHELGHFLAAKWRGLYVEEFALWFGKPLWRKKIGGIWYAINSVPAGGYVKLPQMADMSSIEGASDHLPPEALKKIRPIDKIIVAFAGPLFSFLLAFAMATGVWLVGKPESDADQPVIGEVVAGGPAAEAGLKAGDEVIEVDGKKVSHFATGTDSVTWAIIRSEGEKIPFVVRRNGEVLPPIYSGWIREQTEGWRPALRRVGIKNVIPASVGLVAPKSPGAKAGLQSGDVVASAADKPILSLEDLGVVARENFGKTIPLIVRRGTEQIPLSIEIPPKPATEDAPIPLGVEWGRITMKHPTPWRQVSDAATTIFRMVGALTSPGSDVKAAHFSGPYGILRLYYRVFEAPDGWRLALALSVLINVNLALLNLLPFPVLDGGHITLALVEAVRRKPMNVRVLEVVQTACAMLLIGFMLYVTFYDIGDTFGKKKPSALEEKAKAAEQAKPKPTLP